MLLHDNSLRRGAAAGGERTIFEQRPLRVGGRVAPEPLGLAVGLKPQERGAAPGAHPAGGAVDRWGCFTRRPARQHTRQQRCGAAPDGRDRSLSGTAPLQHGSAITLAVYRLIECLLHWLVEELRRKSASLSRDSARSRMLDQSHMHQLTAEWYRMRCSSKRLTRSCTEQKLDERTLVADWAVFFSPPPRQSPPPPLRAPGSAAPISLCLHFSHSIFRASSTSRSSFR
jgi:hypothetical protein